MNLHSRRSGRIVIIEDESAIADILCEYLKAENFIVYTALDGETGLTYVETHNPDLVLLDLHLPKVSGTEVMRQIRQTSQVPIIILTSRTNEIDRIVGLELGADDYVGKPFSPREVVARVRTVLRRTMIASSVGERTTSPRQRISRLEIDRDAYEVYLDGALISVTPTEFRILDVLAQHLGRAFTRDQLIERISAQPGGGEVFDRTLDRHIANLRRKIEPLASQPTYILTVIGVGYKMVEPK